MRDRSRGGGCRASRTRGGQPALALEKGLEILVGGSEREPKVGSCFVDEFGAGDGAFGVGDDFENRLGGP